MKNYYLSLIAIFIAFWAVSCTSSQKKEKSLEQAAPQEITYSTDDPKSIIKAVEMSCGGWDKLWEQKDVEFTYSYKYPQEGTEDLSTERYVFDTEQSWAKYTKHDINVMPGMEGEVIQYYDGNSAFLKHNESMVEDEAAIGGCHFLRKANYFWFVMMYKLNNPGAQFESAGNETLENTSYDKVKVTYDPEVTGKDENDTYILYVNSNTKMVDQFYFSLPAFGIADPIILMKLEYEEINGLKLATKRSIWMPSENGYSEEANLVQTSTNVKFNNGFTDDTFAM